MMRDEMQPDETAARLAYEAHMRDQIEDFEICYDQHWELLPEPERARWRSLVGRP